MSTYDTATERLVLQQFMMERRWSRAGLKVQLEHVDPDAIDGALVALVVAGVVIPDRGHFQAAPCLRYLDAHGMLAPAVHGEHGAIFDQALEVDAWRSAEDARDATLAGGFAPLVDHALALD